MMLVGEAKLGVCNGTLSHESPPVVVKFRCLIRWDADMVDAGFLLVLFLAYAEFVIVVDKGVFKVFSSVQSLPDPSQIKATC